MGLLYPFPVSEEETDFVVKDDKTLTLKTYGLPYIFWIYAICSVAVVFFMFLAIKAPILKLAQLGDETDALLANSLLTFIGLVPLVIFSFFFYEKRLVASSGKLTIEHRLFGLKLLSEIFVLDPTDGLKVSPFLDSPNIARARNRPEDMGFQNKGYYVLWLMSAEGKKIQVDRHSRKADLDRMKEMLERVIYTNAGP
jgi:hypothetical protein